MENIDEIKKWLQGSSQKEKQELFTCKENIDQRNKNNFSIDYFLKNEEIGTAKLGIYHEDKDINSIGFFPLYFFEDELKHNKLGSLGWGMLLQYAENNWNVKDSFNISYPPEFMSNEFKGMLTQMGVYQESDKFLKKDTSGLISYNIGFKEVKDKTFSYLRKKGFDF